MLRQTCRDVWLCAFSLCFACGIAAGQGVEFLDQNWDDETRQFFYTVSQGSRLLPYDWFMALELKDEQEPLAGDHLLKLGFLKNVNAATNPDELPVGFAMDIDWTGQKYLGLNCAACHTNQVGPSGNSVGLVGFSVEESTDARPRVVPADFGFEQSLDR